METIIRSDEEIQQEIGELESQLTRVVPYSYFGDDNKNYIQVELDVLRARKDLTKPGEQYSTEELEDDEYLEDYDDDVYNHALLAWQWLVDESTENPSAGWEPICSPKPEQPLDKPETERVLSNTMKDETTEPQTQPVNAATATQAINAWIAKYPELTHKQIADTFVAEFAKSEESYVLTYFPSLTPDAVRNRRRRLAEKPLTEAPAKKLDPTPPVTETAPETDNVLVSEPEVKEDTQLNATFKQSNGVTFAMATINGKMTVVTSDNPSWDEAYLAYQNENWSEFLDLARPAAKRVQLSERVYFTEDGKLFVDGKLFEAVMAETFFAYIKAGAPVSRLVEFTERLAQNPYPAVRESLFSFLKHGNLPITEDGHFIAYKYVKEDYGDYHTNGTKDYTPGNEVTEEKFDTNPHNTCSCGLHAGTEEFVNGWGGRRRILLLVDPADVVCVPYNEPAKLRAKRLVSISDWEGVPLQESIYRVEGSTVTPITYKFS
jgi:hypothetical protein